MSKLNYARLDLWIAPLFFVTFLHVPLKIWEEIFVKIFVNIQAHKMWVLFLFSALLRVMSKWAGNVFPSTKLCARACLTSSKKSETKQKVNFFHNDQISIWVFYIVCYKYQQATLLCFFGENSLLVIHFSCTGVNWQWLSVASVDNSVDNPDVKYLFRNELVRWQ